MLARSRLLLLMTILIPFQHSSAITFDELLEEANLEIKHPEGFRIVDATINNVLPYEHAIRREDGALEIRYAIRPLSRLTIDYKDPHNAAPDPNHMFTRIFQALMEILAADSNSPTNEYSPQQAKEIFNADWAAAAVFDVTRSFSNAYSQALFVALHKNNQADAYVVFLYDNYSQVKFATKITK